MLSLLATVGLCLAMTTGPAAHAQTTPSTPSTTPVTVSLPVVSPSPTANQVTPTPDIIPRPNVGQEPRDPGDRGGWWQESLFFLMCGAVLFIGTLVWRDSRRARRR
ncbi:MAG: hypothetical protein ACKV2O_20085, partial [Acidimicrobiales bacterium]